MTKADSASLASFVDPKTREYIDAKISEALAPIQEEAAIAKSRAEAMSVNLHTLEGDMKGKMSKMDTKIATKMQGGRVRGPV